MNPDLEALLKSYDAFFQCHPSDAVRLKEIFEARLEETAISVKVEKEKLRHAIQQKYPRWLKANSPSQATLPFKA